MSMQPYEKYPELKAHIDRITLRLYVGKKHEWEKTIQVINKAIAPTTNSVIAMHLEQIVENMMEMKITIKREYLLTEPEELRLPDNEFQLTKSAIYHLEQAIKKLKQLPD